MKNNFGYQPTPEKPLLIGLLIDVSGSMMSSIQNQQGRSSSRIESFRDALDNLVTKAKDLSRVDSSEKVAPLIKIFAYAFGFGNPLSFLFGGTGPAVRDLLVLSEGSSSTVSIDKLANQWTQYRRHVESMAREMFGNTPMREGFQEVFERLKRELEHEKLTGQPVLFVLSDGEPTDAAPHEIVEIAKAIKNLGVSIVSCYVTDENIARPRYIYGSKQQNWPSGANMMFECASILDENSSFYHYLREYNWTIESNGHFFTQINQSEILSEFMNAVLSPMSAATIMKELHKYLVSRFNTEELRTLCFQLGVDWDNIPGETKEAKVRNLLLYLARRDLIPSLINELRRERPNDVSLLDSYRL